MSGFSADWLVLREVADKAARSPIVLKEAQGAFADRPDREFEICDLGSGTGVSVDAFSHLFSKPQTWHLVDSDAANLERAKARFSGSNAIDGLTVHTHLHNLVEDPAPWTSSTDLVTATALFDLASPEWLREFGGHLCKDQLPLLATLTYDGRLKLEPELKMDAAMIAAFNRHQQTDKGFGPAAGPNAVKKISAALSDNDYEITLSDSSWQLDGTEDRELIHAILDGWSDAALELGSMQQDDVRTWCEKRKKNTTHLQVGHLDLFAKPARRNG